MSCRIYSSVKGIHQVTLLGHRSTVCACFFEKQSLTVSQGHTHTSCRVGYTVYFIINLFYYYIIITVVHCE